MVRAMVPRTTSVAVRSTHCFIGASSLFSGTFFPRNRYRLFVSALHAAQARAAPVMPDRRTETHGEKRDRHGFGDRGPIDPDYTVRRHKSRARVEIVQEDVRERERRDARSERRETDVREHTTSRWTRWKIHERIRHQRDVARRVVNHTRAEQSGFGPGFGQE